METSSPPRNGASHHLDPHRATVFGTRGVGGWSGGARGQVPPPSGALRATQLRATGSAPARAPERPPARLPASPREPARAPARAPAAQPLSRGSARAPHTHAAGPRGLTPVPLSHTTTFLPWLSMVRPGEPPPGLACFLLHTAPPSDRRSAQAGSPRPAAAPSGRAQRKSRAATGSREGQ